MYVRLFTNTFYFGSNSPDMTSYIPYAQQWFVDGLNEVDLRTTDRCVKKKGGDKNDREAN